MFRNQGGSFGIAFVTTLLARRAQYHQSVLATHVTNFDNTLSVNLSGIANRFVEQGYRTADASVSAVARVYAIVQQQANMLAFLDCFWILGLVAFIGAGACHFYSKIQTRHERGSTLNWMALCRW